MGNSIGAVIFDYGGVLSLPPDTKKMLKLAETSGLEPALFEQEYRRHRSGYDRGTLTASDYWLKVLGAGGVTATGKLTETLISLDIEIWTAINHAMVDWSSLLKDRGYRIAVLSNMPREPLAYINKTFPWIRNFDTCIYSCDHGLIKPEPQIYNTCLEALGVLAGEAFFIDDSSENTKAAERLGLHALTFQSLEADKQTIEQQYGLPLS
jgi:putative hydrolase of the HAD superfamily